MLSKDIDDSLNAIKHRHSSHHRTITENHYNAAKALDSSTNDDLKNENNKRVADASEVQMIPERQSAVPSKTFNYNE